VFSGERLSGQGRRDSFGEEFERQVELQRREHEYAQKLADRELENEKKLLAYEHEHYGATKHPQQNGPSRWKDDLLVFAVSQITVLNGAGLLIGLLRASAGPSWPFAAGLVGALPPSPRPHHRPG
jgi:hypothetical protein